MKLLRDSFYASYGAGSVFRYQQDAPKRERTITDTLLYDTGQITQMYLGAGPLFSLRYSLGRSSAVKLGYSRSRQYPYILSNSTPESPTGIWKSSNTYISHRLATRQA